MCDFIFYCNDDDITYDNSTFSLLLFTFIQSRCGIRACKTLLIDRLLLGAENEWGHWNTIVYDLLQSKQWNWFCDADKIRIYYVKPLVTFIEEKDHSLYQKWCFSWKSFPIHRNHLLRRLSTFSHLFSMV